jgi:hypothetical protein
LGALLEQERWKNGKIWKNTIVYRSSNNSTLMKRYRKRNTCEKSFFVFVDFDDVWWRRRESVFAVADIWRKKKSVVSADDRTKTNNIQVFDFKKMDFTKKIM